MELLASASHNASMGCVCLSVLVLSTSVMTQRGMRKQVHGTECAYAPLADLTGVVGLAPLCSVARSRNIASSLTACTSWDDTENEDRSRPSDAAMRLSLATLSGSATTGQPYDDEMRPA